jgi:hypothetical protein
MQSFAQTESVCQTSAVDARASTVRAERRDEEDAQDRRSAPRGGQPNALGPVYVGHDNPKSRTLVFAAKSAAS